MNRRVVRLAVPVTAVLLAAVCVALVAATYAGQHTVSAWEAGHDLPAGSALGAQDVRQVSVAQGGDSYRLASSSPVGQRTTHAVAAGDLLRPDDLSRQAVVAVPVTFKLAPALQPGASVDIYALGLPGVTGGAAAAPSPAQATAPLLVARGVSVVAAGPPVVIQVPAEQEALWVTLASSQTELLATLSSGTGVSSGAAGYQPGQAVQILNQLARGGAASGANP